MSHLLLTTTYCWGLAVPYQLEVTNSHTHPHTRARARTLASFSTNLKPQKVLRRLPVLLLPHFNVGPVRSLVGEQRSPRRSDPVRSGGSSHQGPGLPRPGRRGSACHNAAPFPSLIDRRPPLTPSPFSQYSFPLTRRLERMIPPYATPLTTLNNQYAQPSKQSGTIEDI
jgi:hypothetical protein